MAATDIMCGLLHRHSRKLLRAMSCYTQPCMFVDVSAPRWSIMHINEAVTQQIGEHCLLWSRQMSWHAKGAHMHCLSQGADMLTICLLRRHHTG